MAAATMGRREGVRGPLVSLVAFSCSGKVLQQQQQQRSLLLFCSCVQRKADGLAVTTAAAAVAAAAAAAAGAAAAGATAAAGVAAAAARAAARAAAARAAAERSQTLVQEAGPSQGGRRTRKNKWRGRKQRGSVKLRRKAVSNGVYVHLLPAEKQGKEQTAMKKDKNKKLAWVHSIPRRGA